MGNVGRIGWYGWIAVALGLWVGAQPNVQGADAGMESADGDRILMLSDVTVIGSLEAVHHLPASGDYLDAEDIGFHSYANVHQILRQAPGVYIQEETGFGLLPNISLRGVDSHRSQKVTLMEDGILTAPAAYSAPSAYYSPTVGRMHGLEVLKGSSQVRYGPHTTGGAVNYLSTPVPEEAGGSLKMLYGTDDEFRTHLTYGGTRDTEAGNVGGLIEVHHHGNNGFKTIEHLRWDDDQTGFDKTDTMLKLAWEPRTDRYQRFELKLGYTDFEANETYLGLSESDFADDPYQRYAASQFDVFKGYHIRTHLKHLIEVNESLSLSSSLYYNRFHRNWYKLHELRGVTGEVLAGGQMSMAEAIARGGNHLATLKGENGGVWRVRANNRDYDMWGIQSAAQVTFDWLDAQHTLDVGARFHGDSADRYQWNDDVTVDNAGNVVAVANGAKGGAGDRIERTQAIAVYAQDEIKHGRLSITPGVRYEHLHYSMLDHTTADGTLKGNENVFALGVNASYEIDEQWMLFGGVYRGYSVPSPNDNLTKKLEEETSLSYELGSRYRSETCTLHLAAFYTQFEDLIIGSYVGTAADTDSENAGDIDAYGLEFKAEVDPGTRYGWGLGTPLWLAYTYTDATLDGDSQSRDPGSIFAGGENGNMVPYIPKHQLAIGAGVAIGRCQCELVATYVDDTYSTANNSSAQVNPVTGAPDARFGKLDSRWVLDLSANYDVTETTRLFCTVTNLLDETYVASRHPHGPRPGHPLAAFAGVKIHF